MNTSPDFAGRTALVTGAGGDIGRATASALAASGASLLLAEHPAAEDALAETQKACGGGETLLFDVTDSEAVSAALAGQRIDLLVNNAGYQGEFAPVDDYSSDDFRRVLDVNVMGVFHVLREVCAGLRAAGRPGAVVNIASMAALSGPPNMAAYAASKAAVVGLTMTAARDLAALGIRVNAVSPGFIGEGMMWERQIKLQAEAPGPFYSDDPAIVESEMISLIPLGRPGTLEEVAATIVFLLSDGAGYLTATNTELSGGSF